MKYKNILIYFYLALPISVFLRGLQLFYTIDAPTGFFKPEYREVGFYLIVMIFAVCFAMGILCFLGHRSPEHPPKGNPLLAVAAFVAAASVAIELLGASYVSLIRGWQSALMLLIGVASVCYFIFLGICSLIKKTYFPPLAIIPATYFITLIICNFTSISSLALISDNLLLLASYCVMLLFFISFGKLYNKLDAERNFRKLMAYGMASIILCFTQSIPYFVINVFKNNTYNHTSLSTNISLFAMGIFITVFVFEHFSSKNLTKAYRHKSSSNASSQFYFGD